ncbi:hypothetical protein AB0M61_25825 [Streptomyces sp. NPDC051642]|uniref:hypothetical protein n=1 Tax=Streptomyces sp. NPDC051642 TaxID=3154646 RepID=UPI00343CFC27
MLRTTRCLYAAVAQLQAEGHELREGGHGPALPAQAPQPEPVFGRDSFIASTPTAGVLCPLRAPDAPELDEDETGWE